MATTVSLGATADLGEEGADRFLQVLKRANKGDEQALNELRPMLDAAPKLAAELGDLAKMTRDTWVDTIAGKQLALGEALRRKAAGLKRELSLPSDGPIEALLVDRIVVCWLHLHYAELPVRGDAVGHPSVDVLGRAHGGGKVGIAHCSVLAW